MIDGTWKQYDFSSYDTVYHVAGIAHDTGNKKNADLYYRVNRDLAIETAIKARSEGVKQFIFMSSMLVYNGSKERIITKDTMPKAKGYYGDSKLQADLKLQEMNTNDFKVAVVRPPMIFGPNCKGNFPRLAKLAKKLPIFPDFRNQRSMLYIDNLCEFIRLLIDSQKNGIYFPQNEDYFCTSEIVKILAEEYNHKILFTKLGNWLIYLLKPLALSINKLFGSNYYNNIKHCIYCNCKFYF
ncbi:MAG: NAD-dependent epimerase/dehydratase family protein [Bacilli bacterium]